MSNNYNNLNKLNGLDALAFALEQAKETEARARAARIDAEQALIDALGVKEEGSTTYNGDYYKATTTGKITRRLDAKALAGIWGQLPAAAQNCIKNKPELSLSAFRKLEGSDREAFLKLCAAIESKPAKPSVSIERQADAAPLNNVTSLTK